MPPFLPRASAWLERLLAGHGLPLAGLLLLGFGTFGAALFIHPLDPDNVIVLSFGERSVWSFFSEGAFTYIPAYRPVSQLTDWLQYQIFGLDPQPYFVVNVLVWVACAWLVYALVVRGGGSRAVAALAAAALLLTGRALLAILFIGERQSALALGLGLAALLVLLLPRERSPRAVHVLAFLLLLLSALSKEYGLAFVPAAAVLAFSYRMRDRWAVVAAAGGAVAVYLVLRLGVAGGATGGRFCDQMGYFHESRVVCFDDLGALAAFKQYLWNIAAAGVGTFFPSLFTATGALGSPSARGLVIPALALALAAAGLVRRPRLALPMLTLLAANAVVSFETYRDRNQVIGIAGLYVTAALGLHEALEAVRARIRDWWAPAAAGAALAAVSWLAYNAALRTQTVESFKRSAAEADPCAVLRQYPNDVDPGVVAELKRRYGLPDPDCRGES